MADKSRAGRKAKQTPTSSVTTPQGNNYFFAIAINDYIHCPRLHNAVKDAADLAMLLVEQFGFDKRFFKTLHNEDATESNLYKELRNYAQKLKGEDNLIIFFSGHGEYDEVLDEGYWIPVDAELGNIGTYIANSSLRTYLNAIKCKHLFLIIDSCFSGSFFAQVRRVGLPEMLERDPSRWCLTSGRQEIVSDGKPGENSPFMSSLLYHLTASTEPLSVGELCTKVIHEVGTKAYQLPRGEPINLAAHRGGQFIFRPLHFTGTSLNIKERQVNIPLKTNNKTITSVTPSLYKINRRWLYGIGVIIAIALTFWVIKSSKNASESVSSAGLYLSNSLVQGTARYGYRNTEKNWIIPPKYENAKPFSEGLAAVQRGDYWGYIDSANNVVIDFQYQLAENFRVGLAPVKRKGYWGFINKAGEEVIEIQFNNYLKIFYNDRDSAVLLKDQDTIVISYPLKN